MTSAFPENLNLSRSPRDVPTVRTCLRCKAIFHSEGFGERICSRCKGTSVWKSALPARGDGTRQR